MIWVYKSDIRDYSADDYGREYDRLSESERQRICRISNDTDRRRSIAVKILLRKAVFERFGIENYELKRELNGKPVLDFCKFSLSHSENAAVCAISDNDVGIDVEKIQSIKQRPQYKLFTYDENSYVNKDAQCNVRFLKIWTRKEAVLKCAGFSLEQLAKISVLSDCPGFLLSTEISGEYIISTCERI